MEFKTGQKESRAIKISVMEDGKVIGRAFLYLIFNNLHKEPYGLMEDVFVDEKYRGKGIGTKIVEALIAEAKKQGCYKLIGTSRFSNERAHGLYERLGFTKHGFEFRMDLEESKVKQAD